MKKKFLRTDTRRFLRSGKKKKSLRKWRRAKGVHSKIRRKRKGYPAKPSIGYKTDKRTFGRINGLIPILISNPKQLEKATKENILIIAKVGAKKKIEIIKRANELGLKIANLGGKNESS